MAKPRKHPTRTDAQRAAAAVARKARRHCTGTTDVGLLLALTALGHRERTADELACLTGRPAASVANGLRLLGLELLDRTDHGHDGVRRTVYSLTGPDARAVAAWVRRRDRIAVQPDPGAQASLFDAANEANGIGGPGRPAEPHDAPAAYEAAGGPADAAGVAVRLVWSGMSRVTWNELVDVPGAVDCPRLAA
jgi:hypothetical protein